MNYCPECGVEVAEEHNYCPECGDSLTKQGRRKERGQRVEEKKGIPVSIFSEKRVSPKKLVAWVTGVMFLLTGLILMMESVLAGTLLMASGAFATPWVREEIEQEAGYDIPTWFTVLVVALLFLAASAVLPSSANPEPADPSRTSSGGGADPSDSVGHQVRVQYSGEWQGSISVGSETKSIQGSGTTTYDISGDPFVISANAQKMGGGDTLTVQILEDGRVVQETSTSADYGVAQISYSG